MTSEAPRIVMSFESDQGAMRVIGKITHELKDRRDVAYTRLRGVANRFRSFCDASAVDNGSLEFKLAFHGTEADTRQAREALESLATPQEVLAA